MPSISSNKIFLWIVIFVTLVLLFPFFANHRVDGWNWTLADFVVAGTLLFAAPSVFVLASRKWIKHRLLIGVFILFVFLYIWAELAVGIFTNLGN